MPEKYRDNIHIEGRVSVETIAGRLAAGRARVAAEKGRKASEEP